MEGPWDVWRSLLHELGSLGGHGLVMPDTKISARHEMKEH